MNRTERIKQGDFPLIGYNIQHLREQKHMRNSDMVAKLQLAGISINSSTLSKIEQGSCNPTTAQLIAMQKILGCSYSDFFTPINL